MAGHTHWYYTTTIRIPKVDHPVRILVLWSEADAKQPRKILITNRTYWEAHRILKAYKRRWTGTETFHRDGKQRGDRHREQSDGDGEDRGLPEGYQIGRFDEQASVILEPDKCCSKPKGSSRSNEVLVA